MPGRVGCRASDQDVEKISLRATDPAFFSPQRKLLVLVSVTPGHGKRTQNFDETTSAVASFVGRLVGCDERAFTSAAESARVRVACF